MIVLMSWLQVQNKTEYGIKKNSGMIATLAGVFRERQSIQRTGVRPACLETREQVRGVRHLEQVWCAASDAAPASDFEHPCVIPFPCVWAGLSDSLTNCM